MKVKLEPFLSNFLIKSPLESINQDSFELSTNTPRLSFSLVKVPFLSNFLIKSPLELINQDSFESLTNTPRLSFSLVNPLYFPFPKSFINTPLESINQDSYSEFILTLTIAFLLFKGIKLIISLSNFFKKTPLESINQDSFPIITLKSSENRKNWAIIDCPSFFISVNCPKAFKK